MDPDAGTREVTFSRNLWIEADDFLETPVPKYKRLYPGGPECRLKGAYLITCTGCVKDENGQRHRDPGRVRPGQPGRRPRRRPEGEGRHHPLGGCRHRRGRGGAAVRQPVLRRRPRRRRQELPGLPESQLPGGAAPAARWRPPWRTPQAPGQLPVHAPGLFLRWTARTPGPATWCSTEP